MNVWCTHCEIDKGCTIHPMRPDACRAYSCRFLLDPGMDESWRRPKNSGFVVNTDRQRIVIHVDHERPNAWRAEPFYSTIKKWARGAQPGWPIFVVEGGKTLAVYATHEADVTAQMPRTGK